MPNKGFQTASLDDHEAMSSQRIKQNPFYEFRLLLIFGKFH